nr:hypothetical protein [uncultured Pedobacter sp.]
MDLLFRFHGFNRSTDDLDIWLYDTLDNRKNLRAAFNELDYGDFPSFETMDFVPGWTSIYIDNAIELDIMTSMKGPFLKATICLLIGRVDSSSCIPKM